MTVYVDEIQVWPTAIPCFMRGSCHLWADTLEELHAFAATIGLKRGWFQEHKTLPHYDLTPARRARAIEAGAQETSAKSYLAGMRPLRRRKPEEEREARFNAGERICIGCGRTPVETYGGLCIECDAKEEETHG